MLTTAVTQPAFFPQNQVLAMTALGKKNQNGFPNEVSKTRDSQRATPAKRMAIAYGEAAPAMNRLVRGDSVAFITGNPLRWLYTVMARTPPSYGHVAA